MKTWLKKALYVLMCAILLAAPSNSARALTTVVTIDDTDGEQLGIFSSLKLNSSDYPVIAYWEYGDGDLKIAVCSDVDCAASPAIKTLDSNTGSSNIYGPISMALTDNNYSRISYYAYGSRDLRVAACSNCITSNSVYTVDSAGDVGKGNAIALTAAGIPVISYYDDTNNQLKVAVCDHYTCSGVQAITVVDSFSDIDGDTSIVLNSSGFPVISYYDAGNDDLMLAICSDATCTGKTITIVDGVGNVGYTSSIRLSSQGYPVIAYRDSTNTSLKLAICSDALCVNKTLTTVDNAEDDGGSLSLALKSNDFPVISYQNNTASALKLAACKDIVCINKTITTVATDSVRNDTSLELDENENAVISYQNHSNSSVRLAKVTRADPGFYIGNHHVPYTGSPQAAIVYGYDNGVVSGVVRNIRYNGSPTRPANPGAYAITANFTPDDILNYNSVVNAPVGNFVIQRALTLNGGMNAYPNNAAKTPSNWKSTHFSPADGKSVTSKKEGTASVRISGNGTVKTLTQTRSLSGGNEDVFTFYFWVRGSSVPGPGICRGQVLFYNGNTLVESHTLNCITGTFPYTKRSVQFTVHHSYTKVTVKFTYSKSSGSIWLDDVGIFR